MKRFTIALALVALMAMPVMAERVTPETARKVATTFLNNNGAKSNQLVDLSKAAGFPNLYIFTTESSFVVMSADDCVKPILGYSLTNKFVAEGMPENLRWWLQGYSEQIQDVKNNAFAADSSTKSEWDTLKSGQTSKATSDVIVAPMISTTWDQTYPYNYYCPSASGGPGGHVYAGCVATAMAQVMKYWGYPTTGNRTHSYTHSTYGEQTVNFGTTTYDWDNMPNSLSGSPTQTQIDAVATLIYHCGVSVDMDYGTGASSANSYFVQDAFINYFRYAPSATYVLREAYSDAQWIAFLKSELDESRPLCYFGNNVISGHAFVCDGYRSDDYFHINWGWSGSDGNYGNNHGNNGYWAIGSLSPGAGGSGSGSGTYNLYNAVIAWAEPLSNLEAPTISASASNGIITLSWNEISDAESYDIYKDNVRIETGVVENSYIDNNVVPDTSYEYYVRAVSNSTRSNPSNRITKHTFYRDYEPSELAATLTNNSVELTWLEPSNNSAILQYATNYIGRYGLGEGKDVYWAEVFSPTRLTDFVGMYIEKVSVYLYMDGNYTLYIYQDNTNEETNKLYEQSIAISSQGWYDITLTVPVLLDCTKNLWIVMYYPYTEGSELNYWYPATCGSYNEIPHDDEENNERRNPRYISESLSDFNTYATSNISWLFRTYLTDGTYTYNLYDGTNTVASNIEGTSYTINNIADNTAHQYTVKTNYYGGESAASNMAGLTVGNASLSSLTLEANDKMTVTEDSKLTVSGTLSDVNANNLILENGAQLIHNSDGVAATVKKSISPWTTDPVGGWYFIASPINSNELDPSNVVNLLTDANVENGARTYDLYRLEDDNWKNYRKNAFNLANGKGYLYANENAQTLSFKGEIMPYDAENNTIPLSAGWNLIGNPYTCNVVPNLAYHILNHGATTTSVNANTGLVTPGMGIAVYSENGGTLSLNLPTENASTSNNGNLQMTLNQQITNRNDANTIAIDNTIVSFNESEGLPKFPWLEANSKLYIPKNNEEYAIVSSAAQGELPLNFRAAEDGTYTLSVNPKDVEMNYLHLIDNLTGNNVDLLASPDYTFEAKSTDYASRFRLVFASVCENTDDYNENFAFINNGNIIVYKEGTLQTVDLTGRMIYQGDAKHCVSTTGMAPGVYVLRLITADGVKTQKIVVE